MKNWKFIKTGNSDKEFKSEQELRRWAIDHQYTYKPTHGGYYMLEDDSGKGREPIEAHVSQPVVNKTGNESILTKDGLVNYPDKEVGEINILKRELEGLMRMAEKDKSTDYSKQIESLKKEISEKKTKYALGNKKTGNKRYFSVEEEGGDSRSFQSLSEAKSFADKWRSEGKQTIHIFEIEENDKDPDDFRIVRTHNESIEKQTWSMFKGLSKDAEKEVGNRTVRSEEKGGWISAYINDHRVGHAKLVDVGTGWQANGNIRLGIPGKLAVSGSFFEFYKEKPSADRVAQDLAREWDYKWGSNSEAKEFIGNKVGNSYTPNPELIKVLEAWLHNRMSEQEARAKIMKITGDKNITDMMIHSPGGFIPAGNKKTGNGTPGTIAAIGPHWSHGGTVYGKMDTDESGKLHNEYVKITWLGEGRGGVANYFVDDKIQSDKFGSINKDELKRWAEQKIGNRKIGSDDYEVVGSESGKYYVSKNGGQQILGPFASTDDANKKIDEIEKTGAQTNNMKRARNSIKTKNSDVTLWNGNDTAYIKEDGHVQFLENNAFLVEEDKYDSQEQAVEDLTKKGYRKK